MSLFFRSACGVLGLSFVLFFQGCTTLNSLRYPASEEPTAAQHKVALQRALLSLPGAGNEEEAARIAEVAVGYSERLAERYRVSGPPLFHNMLVNVGLKERGLCYHYADDLEAELSRIPLRHYQITYLAARHERRFRAHYSLAIGLAETPLEERIVLDAWRHAGKLYWGRVVEDTKYPWRVWK